MHTHTSTNIHSFQKQGNFCCSCHKPTKCAKHHRINQIHCLYLNMFVLLFQTKKSVISWKLTSLRNGLLLVKGILQKTTLNVNLTTLYNIPKKTLLFKAFTFVKVQHEETPRIFLFFKLPFFCLTKLQRIFKVVKLFKIYTCVSLICNSIKIYETINITMYYITYNCFK